MLVIADGIKETLCATASEMIKEGITDVITCASADELLLCAQRYMPDEIITDIVLPGNDGTEVVRQLRALLPDAAIVIYSSFAGEYAIDAAIKAGANYYIAKPMPAKEILLRIEQCSTYFKPVKIWCNRLKDIRDDTMRKISALLGGLGMQYNRLGYRYTSMALYRLLQGAEINGIYQTVAMQNGTTAKCVERSIRSAVEDVFTSGNINAIDEVFGNTVRRDTGKPTNMEFLSAVYQKLRITV